MALREALADGATSAEFRSPGRGSVGRVARRQAPGGRQGVADAVGLSPAIVIYSLFMVVPVLGAIALSFLRWNGLGAPVWAGLANWSLFFRDPIARQSLEITGELVVASWVIQTPISMALGFWVSGSQRYRAVYATIFLLPLLLSTVGIALMWEAELDPQFGGLSWLATHFHLAFLNQNWLGGRDLALPVVIAIIAWQFIPFHTLLYQLGRRQVPKVLYEAALLDGAGGLATLLHVTLPQIRYTIVASSTLMVVGSLTYFDIIFVLTDGGPGYATQVLSLDMYRTAFINGQFGYAGVLAVVLGVIGIAVALGLTRLTGFTGMGSQQEGVA